VVWDSRPVVRFAWQNPTNATPWAWVIATVLWDEADVRVGHRLAGGGAIINAHVVPVWRVVPLDCLLCRIEEFQ